MEENARCFEINESLIVFWALTQLTAIGRMVENLSWSTCSILNHRGIRQNRQRQWNDILVTDLKKAHILKITMPCEMVSAPWQKYWRRTSIFQIFSLFQIIT